MRNAGRKPVQFAIAASAVLLLWPVAGHAIDRIPVGVAAVVKLKVDGIPPGAPPQTVTVGEDILFQEKLITTTDSGAVVQFRDRSTLEVGPNATIVINKSVYNPVESVSEKSITVVAGAFRFVSGVVSTTSSTDIHTPVGTLGIRGSIVIGDVSPQGDVTLIPVEGQPTWTGQTGTQTVPQGGALIGIFKNQQSYVSPQAPPSLASLLQTIMAQLPPPSAAAQNFNAAQIAANAQLHTVSAAQQEQMQAGGDESVVVEPLDPNGQSALSTLMSAGAASFANGGVLPGQTAQQAADALAYINSVTQASYIIQNQNSSTGTVQVTQELFTVLTPAQLVNLGTSLAALEPNDAALIASTLVSLVPTQSQNILNSIAAVVPPTQVAQVTAAVNATTGQALAAPQTTTNASTVNTTTSEKTDDSPH